MSVTVVYVKMLTSSTPARQLPGTPDQVTSKLYSFFFPSVPKHCRVPKMYNSMGREEIAPSGTIELRPRLNPSYAYCIALMIMLRSWECA
jgi:hypothetical protein